MIGNRELVLVPSSQSHDTTRVRWPLLLLLSACAWNQYDHETVATVGFSATPRIFVIERTIDPLLADAARREVLAAGRPQVVAVRRLAKATIEEFWKDTPEAACRREVLGLPSADGVTEEPPSTAEPTTSEVVAPVSTPPTPIPNVDLVLVISTHSSAEIHKRCPILNRRVRWRHGTGKIVIDPSADSLVTREGGTPGGPEWDCTERAYSHTVATATVDVARLNPDCTFHDGGEIPATSEAIVASGNEITDPIQARARARGQTLVGPLRANAARLLPRGLRLVSQQGSYAALEGAVTLGGDNPFRIDAQRGGGRTTATFIIDRATPSGIAGEVFTVKRENTDDGIVSEKIPFQIRLSDRVQRRAYTHELKLLPQFSVGRVRAESGTSAAVAGVAALRWQHPRMFTAAEVAYSHGLEVGQDSRRREGTLALGPALALHPVRLRGYVEANLLGLRRTEPIARSSLELGLGAGVGLDLWIRNEVITLDIRHRWSQALRDRGPVMPPAIEDASVWLFQLGYAFRIDKTKGEPPLPKVGTAVPR